jgi:hypothetical protein
MIDASTAIWVIAFVLVGVPLVWALTWRREEPLMPPSRWPLSPDELGEAADEGAGQLDMPAGEAR